MNKYNDETHIKNLKFIKVQVPVGVLSVKSGVKSGPKVRIRETPR